MQFKAKHTLDSTDIPVSVLFPSRINSQDMILSYDLSSQVPGNNIPPTGFIKSRTRAFGGITELEIKNPFSKIQITDRYFYNQNTKTDEPLWYKHVLKHKVLNTTVQTERIIRDNVNGQRTFENIVSGEKIIVSNSENIRQIVNSDVISLQNYYIDTSKKSITVSLNVLSKLEIEVDTLIPNIDISQQDQSAYIIEYNYAGGSEYNVTIYTESSSSLRVTYTINDKIKGTTEVVERTNAEVIYNEIPVENINDQINNTKEVFALQDTFNNNYRVLLLKNQHNENYYKEYSFRPFKNNSSKIRLLIPIETDKNSIWLPEVTGIGYTYKDQTTNELIDFNIPELSQVNEIATITETVSYIDKNRVRLSKIPQWELDLDNKITKINLIDKDSGAPVEIQDIETNNRIVWLSREIGKANRIQATYKYKRENIGIGEDINPLHDKTAYNYYHLYFIVPKSYLIDNNPRSIFIHKINRFNNYDRIIMNSQDFIDYFNTNFSSILTPYLSEFNEPISNMKAYPISVFYIETPVDRDFIEIIDSRRRGGGFVIYTLNCGDWSRWDGETIDLSGRLLIKIKQSLYDELVSRFLQWEEQVYLSPNPQLKAEELVNNWITKYIEKFVPYGTNYTWEIF